MACSSIVQLFNVEIFLIKLENAKIFQLTVLYNCVLQLFNVENFLVKLEDAKIFQLTVLLKACHINYLVCTDWWLDDAITVTQNEICQKSKYTVLLVAVHTPSHPSYLATANWSIILDQDHGVKQC